MQFIDNGLCQRSFQRPVILPVEVLIAYHAAGVGAIRGWFSPLSWGKLIATGVDKNLIVIIDKALAAAAAWTVKAVTVAEVLLMGEQENMPHIAGAVFFRVENEFMAECFGRTLRQMVDYQRGLGGVAGENGKIHTFLEDGNSRRQGVASFSDA